MPVAAKTQGLMAIQAITIADQRYDYYSDNVDFIQKYIFPGGFYHR
ncbi:S-adenosyl-L-methionine dependent methyltransferase [Vibrio variabilis]|uniref:S-adenosyl-L-methionine dependent methyltransferase n=1 Tax=Vibrio variabilis TaxID=990271 RepID=A0ABQ0J9D3_9VIBR|nr:S-adenosyl-L-methionine dependent methyltransferase [Vibrio variabilis]